MPRAFPLPLRFAAVFLLYVLGGWAGLSLATYGNAVTLIWPPTGVAMFALLGWGMRLWPAIWLAAFAVNVLVADLPLVAALGVATGNTVGPLLGAWALGRLRFSHEFASARDALLFVGVGAFGSGLLTSINGTLLLVLGGVVPGELFLKVWLTWWMGDAVGAMVVGPALLSLLAMKFDARHAAFKGEAAAAWAGMLLVTLVSVSPLQPFGTGLSPLFTFPFVIWLALRIGAASGTWGVMLVAAAATWSATAGVAPFAGADGQVHPGRLWSFIATLGGAGLLVVAMRNESARALEAALASESRLRLLAGVFQHSGEGIMVTDRDNRIIEVNTAFSRMTGYAPAEVLGQNPRLLSSGRTTTEEYQSLWQAITRDGFWKGELWDRRKDGDIYPVLVTISTIRDAHGAVAQHIASYTDITERKTAEERISYLAHHDALTKLPNRLNLYGRLEQALAAVRRDGAGVAVLLIDLDNFKTINDTLGHNVGDGILVEVARRLRESVRDSDIVARLGGDEFVVVLTEVGSGAVPVLAGKLLQALGQPYSIQGYELHTTPSIGISVFPEDGDSVDGLIKNADVAMYHAKSNGRNNFQFFTSAMNVSATERLVLENSLRHALERRQFLLHFQPQIEVASGRVLAVEALVRWQHPERGMVAPNNFIPIAEDTGLILPLGAWVLEAAVAQLAAWEAEGVRGLRMAVNLSARQLRDAGLLPLIEAVLARHGVKAQQLELEITESVAMENPERTSILLARLRAMGVGLAIDDFGTGYSSLAYLKRLPVGTLKIDRSFVMDIEHDENDAAICTATISLAHSLGLSVVAEGVETAAQLAYLRELGCDQVQGYHFSKPLPAAECAGFIRSSRAGAGSPLPG